MYLSDWEEHEARFQKEGQGKPLTRLRSSGLPATTSVTMDREIVRFRRPSSKVQSLPSKSLNFSSDIPC